MMRYLIFLLLPGLAPVPTSGQGTAAGELTADIAFYADAMVNAVIPAHRARARAAMEESLAEFVTQPGSFSMSLDSIRGLSVLHGEDFRIVTWQHMVSDSIHQYGGFIQWAGKVTWLRDTRPFLNGSAYSVYTPDAWYGCLYYDLIPFVRDGKKLYILLGFHAQDNLLNTKLADVLEVTDGQVRLGVAVFTGNDRPRTRLLLHYADRSTVHIRFDEALNGIVHDHLESLPGVGPNGEPLPVADGSLEAWILRKGEWVYEAEVYDVPVKEPPMLDDRKDRKEDKDILGRPKKQ